MDSSSQTPVLRAYRPGDFNRYLGLRQAVEEAKGKKRTTNRAGLAEELGGPGLRPQENLLLAEAGGELWGAILLIPEPGIGRVILRPLVHPDHRRRGLGRLLMKRGLRTAGELGGQRAQVEVDRANTLGRRFLVGNGFAEVRRFWEMGLDLEASKTGGKELAQVPCGCLLPGQEDVLTRLQNKSFTGSWGFNPNTVQEVAYALTRGRGSIKDVLVAFSKGRPSGYCWLKLDPETGPGVGRVHMLGVVPESRQRGAGFSVLSWGLDRLREMGCKRAVLTVDRLNPPALALYQRAGFAPLSETIWYEKDLIHPDRPPG